MRVEGEDLVEDGAVAEAGDKVEVVVVTEPVVGLEEAEAMVERGVKGAVWMWDQCTHKPGEMAGSHREINADQSH